MYNLGAQFKFDLNRAKGNKDSIIMGNKYRFTVLTESLIRLEYSPTGEFIDNPSELVWYRMLPRPEFYVEGDNKYLQIKTRYFTLTYDKESKFGANPLNPSANLRIELFSSEKVWYYKHPEVRNYEVPCGEFDRNNELSKIKGLYSTDGFVSIDDSKSLIFLEDGTLEKRKNENNIDIYVFMYGTLFYKCLSDYYKITGYPALVPRYALGIWWYKDIEYNDYTLNKLLVNFQNKKVPLSVLVLNDDWHINHYQKMTNLKTGFTFDPNDFKEPNKMITYLHNRKIKLALSLNATTGIREYEKYYQMALKFLKPDRHGVIPFNVYDNVFLDVYFKIFVHSLTNYDVDFFKLDNLDNKTTQFYLNHYHSMDAKVINNRRNLLLTYDSYIAPHRYPVIYSGDVRVDWESLKKIVNYNINLANRGISYAASSYGGFHDGIEDSELYLRFIQLATFSPIFLLASTKGKYYKREPWKWDYHTFVIAREFMCFRQKLVPYLYTESYRFTSQGVPLIEPVYYRFPELYDDELYCNEYFLGSSLFVCPILHKKEDIMKRSIHRFFLPEGIWYDLYSGKKFLGNKKYVLFYSDETYPVFVREGAIIPTGYNDNINDVDSPTNLEINIFPGTNNKYVLYEDDSISDNYKKGYSFETEIEYKYLPNNYEITIKPKEGNLQASFPTRNFKIIFKNVRSTATINAFVNLQPLPFRKYDDGNDLIVELNNVNTNSRITLKCTGKDIEVSNFRVLNDDIEGIISDLFINTELKNQIDAIMFSDMSIKKKRIEIRKLKSKGLEPGFIKLFLKLLEYVATV